MADFIEFLFPGFIEPAFQDMAQNFIQTVEQDEPII
jgi:hypothetical protein